MEQEAKQSAFSRFIKPVGVWIKTNAVLCIAIVAAAITCFFVPIDEKYLGYFDFKTLSCLFSVLAVVCALRNVRFFTILASKIVQIFKTLRSAVIALVYITFIGSMLIANDMALLTFLPLGYYVLATTGKKRITAFVFIMQNIAANLGGMLTPFGNPQNLYLYTFFSIPTDQFMLTMLPPFLISIALITVCCLFVPNEKLEIHDEDHKLPVVRTIIYGVLFVISIIIVFNVIPYYVGLAIIFFTLLFMDRKALVKVDYGLLLTFGAFFIFSGNMARIDGVRQFFSSLLAINPLIMSALSCQVISNVPSAILLSQFTTNWQALLVGVNIGGAGTLISSLASLITFREYTARKCGSSGKYIALFSLFNFGFLIVLCIIEYFILF